MSTAANDGPTILPTGGTPASDDPQHATLVEDAAPRVVHDPVIEAEEDGIVAPATPGAAAMPAAAPSGAHETSGHDTVHETGHDTGHDTGRETSGAHAPSAADEDWLTLQGKFVDDPAAAVREAGERVTQEFEALRKRLEAGSTEDLRTAFQRYRSLHEALDKEASR